MPDDLEQLVAERDRLRAALDRLRAALEPFAKWYESYGEDNIDKTALPAYRAAAEALRLAGQ